MFTWIKPTYEDRRQYIRKEQPFLLETPRICSCDVCSNKSSWTHRSILRKMREEVKFAIDEYEQERDDVRGNIERL